MVLVEDVMMMTMMVRVVGALTVITGDVDHPAVHREAGWTTDVAAVTTMSVAV